MKEKKVFYGWYVVAACFVMLCCSVGIAWNCLSQFIKPICDDLGYSRSQVALVQTILYGVNLCMSLLAGKTFKTFKLSTLLKVGTFILPLGWIMFSMGNTILWFYLASAISTLGIFCIGMMPSSIIINNWFHEKVGTVMGLTFMGSGFGGMLFNSVCGVLLTHFTWRTTFMIFAGIIFVLVAPCTFFIIKVTPQEKGLLPYGQKAVASDNKPELTGLTFKETLGTVRFWAVAGCLVLYGIPSNMLTQTVSPHLSDIGYSLTFAANMAAVFMGSLAVGKLLLGMIFDKAGVRAGAMLVFACAIVSLTGLYNSASPFMLIPAAVGCGLACSFGTVGLPLITRDFFGNRDYTAIYGLISASNSLGGMLSPIYSNGIFEAAGSYNPAYLIGIGLVAAVAIVMFFALSKKITE